jgi:hypothetical protein
MEALLSLISLPDYIFVGDFAFGFRYQYSKDSRKSAKGKLALKGMIREISSIAECKETANLNLTSSSANF